jgi:hypothetical protein
MVVAMVTPCRHYFHVVCLMQCMELKKMCPLDRTVLPPME